MDRSPVALYLHVLDDISCHLATNAVPISIVTDPAYPMSGFPNLDSAVCSSLLRSIIKKYHTSSSDSLLKERAIASFLESNDICRTWSEPSDALFGLVYSEMKRQCYKELPGLDWQQLLATVRSGPGASVLSHGRNSFLEKFFINPFTTTEPALYSEYRTFMWQKPSWASAELQRIKLNSTAVTVVHGSKLSTVPKNCNTDRTICTEPSLNMMFQLCLGDAFNDVLKVRYGYDPALQPNRNRLLACDGSRDGKTATIDLKSASDRISHSLCEDLLPSDWCAAINDCRSPLTEIDGSYHRLHMVSSMGNGFTFPLQTYIFSLAVKCLCSILNVRWRRYDDPKTRFGVFGDDIIVPTRLYQPLVKLLSSIGFQVNVDKSFADGCFRESCGTDWFQGSDIRGVYCRDLLSNSSLYSLVNRLNRWSAKHGIPLPGTIQYILPVGWRRFRVPYDEPDTAGVKSDSHHLSSGGIFRYTALRQRPKLVRFMRKDLCRAGFENPYGIFLSASIGALSSSGVSRRQANVRYFPTRLFTPVWVCRDWLERDGITRERDWEDTLYRNLPFL